MFYKQGLIQIFIEAPETHILSISPISLMILRPWRFQKVSSIVVKQLFYFLFFFIMTTHAVNLLRLRSITYKKGIFIPAEDAVLFNRSQPSCISDNRKIKPFSIF